MQSGKTFLIWALGFIAILLAAFLFNITVGALLITIIVFIMMKPVLEALSSKTPVDTFVDETVKKIEAVPEVIERVESIIHDEVDVASEKVSKLWHHHHAEVDGISNELNQLANSRKIREIT